jgi:Right handed beta helix region
VNRKSARRSKPVKPEFRTWPIVACALTFFLLLAMLPTILPLLHLNLHSSAPQSSNGVKLMTAPTSPRPIKVPAPATPVSPDAVPAFIPKVDATREASTVAAEDKRLRTVLHSALRVYQPEVVSVRGSLPTLVLTASQTPYSAQTLVQYGAMVMLPHNTALLIDNVFVSDNAKLDLGASNLRTLYMESGSGGFATIVAWDGTLKFSGTTAHPMTITGWDVSASAQAADEGYGRSYIREAGGTMNLTEVRATSLGFWSGRTGGVSWTGLSDQPSSGGAVKSTFTDETYGAFVSRSNAVTFKDDLFEYNEVDGLHVHRLADNTRVIGSAAVRNGADGFSVSPATSVTLFEDDISENNGGDGFHVNGRPLATGASASGGSVALGTNTDVEYSSSLKNGKVSILIEGGEYTVVKGDQVCGGSGGVEVNDGASDAVVTGNTIGCSPRSGIELGPSTPNAVVSGNVIDGARTGILVNSSGIVQLDKNTITGASVFGISARGATSSVNGVGNTISGSGFRALDARADAPPLSLSDTNVDGWDHRAKVTFLTYLEFHPLAALWLGIALLLLLAWMWPRRRVLWHPYPHSTRWTQEDGQLVLKSDPANAASAWDVSAVSAPAPAWGRATPELVGAAAGVSAPNPSRLLSTPVAPAPHRLTSAPATPPSTAPAPTAPSPVPTPQEVGYGSGRPSGGGARPRHDIGTARPPWETMPNPKLERDS